MKTITSQEVQMYLQARKKFANLISIGVSLCIISTIFVLLGVGLSTLNFIPQRAAIGTGIIMLLIVIAISVGIFIYASSLLTPYSYLEKDNFDLETGLKENIKVMQSNYRITYTKFLAIGVISCILSVIPVLWGTFFLEVEADPSISMLFMTSLTILIAAIGVFLLVKINLINESYKVLLQEGEHSPEYKLGEKRLEFFSPIYWSSMTLIYLAVSFLTMRWDITWLIWIFAGIIYDILVKIFSRRKIDLSE